MSNKIDFEPVYMTYFQNESEIYVAALFVRVKEQNIYSSNNCSFGTIFQLILPATILLKFIFHFVSEPKNSMMP